MAPTRFLVLVIAGLAASGGAWAQSWATASAYNGYGASTQNTPSNYSLRDANGNLTLVNGQFVPSTYASASGSASAYSGAYASAGVLGGAMTGGVGLAGAGTLYNQATAIGNSLNVEVVGNHNTTVIDTTQINNGNQTATASTGGR